MGTYKKDIKDTLLQLVKSLECPICLEILRDPLSTSCHHRFCRLCLEKALQDNYKIPCPLCKTVVTKRSLTQSDLIVKLVDKVKHLVHAVKNDIGVEVTPLRSQVASADTLLEQRSVHSSIHKDATCKSSLNFGSRATTKRAFVVHTDADVGAASKKPRSTSTALHDNLVPSRDESHGSISSRKSSTSLQEANENCHTKTKQVHVANAKSSMGSASVTAENMSVASSSSARRDRHSNLPEAPMDVEMQPCHVGSDRHLEECSAENHTEKVQDWLKKCDSVPQKKPPMGLENSEAKESCSDPTEKPLGSNRFFTSANEAPSVSAKRNAVLDVSDTDPYKFVPSQKSLQAAQRGRRRRLRGSGRAAGLVAKRSSGRKSDCQKSVCEFENLRDIVRAEEKAQEEEDAQELEIELFVTPGVRPCVEKKVINQRRSHTTARKRPRKIKSNLQLKPLEQQTEELQRKILEAERHNLVVVKTLKASVEGKQAELTRNSSALKDVSNLNNQVENKGQNVIKSSLPLSPSEEENLLQPPPPELDEPISCHAGKTNTITHSKTCAKLAKEIDVVDLCSDNEGNVLEASDKCKDLAPEGIAEKVMPEERCAHSDMQENATVTSGPAVDASTTVECKGSKQGDNAPDGHCQEDSLSEEQGSSRPLSLKDFEGFFKKSSRKTFDINANTQDLESLGSAAVDTLELMTDVCNSLKRVPASEPDLVPPYAEPESTVMHTNYETVQQVSIQEVGDTLLHDKDSNVVEQYSRSGSDGVHKGKDRQQSPLISTSCPASLIVADAEKSVRVGSPDRRHVSDTQAACPACNAHLSLMCVDGVIKVILKGQPQQPVLVETGMCTEKPFTKVIICREAMTQTESSDTKELDPGSCGDSCSSLPSPHLSLNALDTMQVPATIGNDAGGKVLSAKKDSHFSNTSTNFNSSSAHGSCSSLEEGLAMRSHMQLAKPTVEDAVLKTTKEILNLGKPNKHSQGTEILCENTEDQAALPGRPNLFRASQFGLRTVVEDTEEMDTTPSVKSKDIDKLQSSPLQHDNNPQKCDWNEKQEVQSEFQCSAETSLLKSQNEAYLRRENTKLPDLRSKCSETSPSSWHTKKVSPQYKQSTGSSSQQNQMEMHNNDVNACREEARFLSHKSTQHSMQEKQCDLKALPNEDTCHQTAQASAVPSSDITHGPVPEAKCDQDLSSSITPSFATACNESEPQKGSSSCADIAHSPEKVAHGSPSAVSPNGQSSAESSPWSSPILIRRVAPQSIRNRARKALESSDTTSREEITNSCEIIEPSAKVESRRKSFRQVPSVAVESDSDSDPVTESEAEELLRRAVQEEDSEEAAVIFAKRAVAPLEVSKKSHTSQLQASKRAFWSPEKRHSTQRPTQQSGTPSQGKYHGLWKKHDSSTNDGDGSENTGGHSLATTMSSTLSEGLDQTLKEKRLEQDIEKMKKQMMMLENELQKTTAGKSTTESHSRKDSGASSDVVAMHGKENNWDWDDSDGADEVMDVVPPTPPRKPRKSSNDGSFCSTRK